jgi:molybdate transport system permease protein
LSLISLPPELWQSLWLTIRLAATSTLILLALAIPIAGWLSRTRARAALFVEVLTSLPVVLPPTVIGFYLLLALGAQSPVGHAWMTLFGHSLAFSFTGLVIGSVIYSLPFAVQPIEVAFRAINPALVEAAASLGATTRQRFWRLIVRASRRGIYSGAALSFAHTMGEFGVVLMLGGNIPGVTRVASIALYDETQKLNYAVAHTYALVLLAISFVMLLLIAWLRRATTGAPPHH